MQRNPVGWFEIYVQDMDRARAFYEQTLQVTLNRLAVIVLRSMASRCGRSTWNPMPAVAPAR